MPRLKLNNCGPQKHAAGGGAARRHRAAGTAPAAALWSQSSDNHHTVTYLASHTVHREQSSEGDQGRACQVIVTPPRPRASAECYECAPPPSAGCPAPKCSAHTACFQVKLLAAVGSMELLHCAV